MLRRVIRWLTGPTGRRLGLALVVTTAWVAWWYWPTQPLASWTASRFEIDRIALTPDWRTLATAPLKYHETASTRQSFGSVGPVSLRDLTTGRERLRLADGRLTVVHLAFSPDGALLAVEDRQGGLHVWDAVSGQPVADLTTSSDPHEGRHHNLAHENFTFAPVGRTVAFERPDRRGYALWDAATGTVLPLDGARRPV